MRRLSIVFVVGVIALTTTTGVHQAKGDSTTASSDSLPPTNSVETESVATLRAEIQRKNAELSTLRSRVDKAEGQLEQARSDLQAKSAELSDLKAQLSQAQDVAKRLSNDLTDSRSNIAENQALIHSLTATNRDLGNKVGLTELEQKNLEAKVGDMTARNGAMQKRLSLSHQALNGLLVQLENEAHELAKAKETLDTVEAQRYRARSEVDSLHNVLDITHRIAGFDRKASIILGLYWALVLLTSAIVLWKALRAAGTRPAGVTWRSQLERMLLFYRRVAKYLQYAIATNVVIATLLLCILLVFAFSAGDDRLVQHFVSQDVLWKLLTGGLIPLSASVVAYSHIDGRRIELNRVFAEYPEALRSRTSNLDPALQDERAAAESAPARD
jgi:predicted  nucleic acid-binding Zn-ribbon protein